MEHHDTDRAPRHASPKPNEERLASCFWCEAEHLAEHPLSVCPACVEIYREKRFPLGALEMSGPFRLDDGVIDAVVNQTSPGNYALGYLAGDTFLVFYTRFAFSSASSPATAFEKECRNHDDFGGSVALDDTARCSSPP